MAQRTGVGGTTMLAAIVIVLALILALLGIGNVMKVNVLDLFNGANKTVDKNVNGQKGNLQQQLQDAIQSGLSPCDYTVHEPVTHAV